MGWSEEQYESEWDDKLSRAEVELDEVAAWHAAQEELTEEEAEDTVVDTALRRSVREERIDLDSIMGKRDERRHLLDEEVDLTASDAYIRADIYDITGEKGVLPGDVVHVDMAPDTMSGGEGMTKTRDDIDFGVGIDDDAPVSTGQSPSEAEGGKQRRTLSRRTPDDEDSDPT